MLEVAEIIRLHGAAYRARVAGSHLLPSQARGPARSRGVSDGGLGRPRSRSAITAGGRCIAYHSCRNRHCPKCHGDQTDALARRRSAPGCCPVAYYLITFTLPRRCARSPSATSASSTALLMRSAAAALQRSPPTRAMSARRSGCLAVLHTWTRAMLYHPHVHLLVTAGGLSADRHAVDRPEEPRLPRARSSALVGDLPREDVRRPSTAPGYSIRCRPRVWTTPWVVHAQPAGRGPAASSTTWGAISSASRSPTVGSSRSTTDRSPFAIGTTGPRRRAASPSPASSFSQRFLQHVLPRGCTKVRYYGLWSATRRADLDHGAQRSCDAARGHRRAAPPRTPGATAATDAPPMPVPCVTAAR